MTNYDAGSAFEQAVADSAEEARRAAAVDFGIDERLEPTDIVKDATRGQLGDHVDQETLASWNLRRIRQALGLSQQQVSDKLAELGLGRSRLSQSQLAKMERGERPFRVNEMYDLAEALGIDPFEFFAGQMWDDDRELRLLAARLGYQRAVDEVEQAEEVYKEAVRRALHAGRKLVNVSAYVGIKDATAMGILAAQAPLANEIEEAALEIETPDDERWHLPHVQAKLAAKPAYEERLRKNAEWAEEQWARRAKQAEEQRKADEGE